MQRFLAKNFRPVKTEKLRIEINNFAQFDGETFYEAWEQYKELLRKCPHHGLPKWMEVHHFYNGLNGTIRTLLDASAREALISKSEAEAYQLLKNMAINNCQRPSKRVALKKAIGMYDVDVFTNLATQVSLLAKQLQVNQLQSAQFTVNAVQACPPLCESCNGPYPSIECQVGNPFGQMTIEKAQFLEKFPQQQQFNPYSNSCHPSWRNHPNFS